ncbi:hypothetical protein E6C67_26860 [Azospirillum sp. TSA2s]|uniref:hypothetical protein n=1 Tax=Azospirillum sp. TSA2s TaxID=709810 RepID=UPI0010AA089E|nr:hypothetical protein [Azospirillum sp. TSA2s]QCG97393.1 hypothetical protein E6C67_26860 [Azospirillum sp. TSA2s]
MVKVNEAEWDKARKLKESGGNQMTEVEEKLLGRSIRLDIPLIYPSILPEIAELLRDLADTIDDALESQEGTLRARMFKVKYAGHILKGTIKDRRAEMEKAEREKGQKR